jgi:hypothetical protein
MQQPFSDGDRRTKLTSQEVSGRIAGLSIPRFGLSWNPPDAERKIIQRLILFLEERRVLYDPLELELFAWASDSILGIRSELTKTLQKLGSQSKAIPHLKAMRAACIQYLDQIRYLEGPDKLPWVNYFTWLGELRGVFGSQIAQLSAMYGVDLEGDIVKILPTPEE